MSDDTRSFGYKLTLEHSVDPNASIVAKRDRFSPCEALLEENVLEVGANKRVLNRIAVVIKGLHHVFSPLLAQSQGSSKEDLVILYQALNDLHTLLLKLQCHRFEPKRYPLVLGTAKEVLHLFWALMHQDIFLWMHLKILSPLHGHLAALLANLVLAHVMGIGSIGLDQASIPLLLRNHRALVDQAVANCLLIVIVVSSVFGPKLHCLLLRED